MLLFLEHMTHQYVDELAIISVLLLQLSRRLVIDRRIAEHGASAFFDVLVQVALVLAQVHPKSRLLLLTILQKRKVDAEIKFVELMLTPMPDSIQSSRVVSILLPNFLHSINPAMYFILWCLGTLITV